MSMQKSRGRPRGSSPQTIAKRQRLITLYEDARGAMAKAAEREGCSVEYVRQTWRAVGFPPYRPTPKVKAARPPSKHGRNTGWFKHEYEAAVKDQDGQCAICGSRGARRLHADHDHKTGQKRGLVCYRCNMMLGYARDNPLILERGADYLRRADVPSS